MWLILIPFTELPPSPPILFLYIRGFPGNALETNTNRTHSKGEVMKVKNRTLYQTERESESWPRLQTIRSPMWPPWRQPTTWSRTNHKTSAIMTIMDIIIRLLRLIHIGGINIIITHTYTCYLYMLMYKCNVLHVTHVQHVYNMLYMNYKCYSKHPL